MYDRKTKQIKNISIGNEQPSDMYIYIVPRLRQRRLRKNYLPRHPVE